MIRVGILGTAAIAKRFLAPAFIESPYFELIGFSSRDSNQARNVSEDFGCRGLGTYDEMLNREDIDLVYIPLPTGLHCEWVLKALSSNKHVLCEKSLGLNFQEVETIVKTAISMNKLVMESFQFRFHSQHEKVKSWLSTGKIGSIRNFRSSFGFPPLNQHGNIRYKKELGGGAFLDAGAYTVKAAQFILGANLNVTSASTYSTLGFEVDIYGSATLTSIDSVTAQLSYGFDNFYQCNYEIWGSKGRILVNRAFTAGPDVTPTVLIETDAGSSLVSLPRDNHFVNMLKYIAEIIKDEDYQDEYAECLSQSRLMSEILNSSNF